MNLLFKKNCISPDYSFEEIQSGCMDMSFKDGLKQLINNPDYDLMFENPNGIKAVIILTVSSINFKNKTFTISKIGSW